MRSSASYSSRIAVSGPEHKVLDHTTVAETLGEATRVLSAAGVHDAEREATALWAALTGRTPGDVWFARTSEVPRRRRRAFRDAVGRRARGEPRSYVVGYAGFRTLDLRVDRRVLIPRPETEGLVERVLDWARDRTPSPDGSWGRVADVGTGSGCIALSLAVEGRFSFVVATDSSWAALDVARENVSRVGPPVPVELRHGSLCQPLSSETFEVVVSNPPYVTEWEYAHLDASVRGYEPGTALVGGTDGMEHTRTLIEETPSCLAPGGLLALEVDCTRALTALAVAQAAGFRNARLERDVFGHPRYLLATTEAS